jgi:FkbM family methyltransferase
LITLALGLGALGAFNALSRRVGLRVRSGSRPEGPPVIVGQRESTADERNFRKAIFSKASEFTPYLAVEAEELLFFVATDDTGVGRPLFVKRSRQDMRHLGTAVGLLAQLGLRSAESTFVDVGANIGTTTVTALRRYQFARAVALEPEPGNFGILRLNLVANNIESVVTALQVAVSDGEGEERLVLSATSSGRHTLAPAVPEEPATTTIVPAVTLDGLVARGVIDPDGVGLLWIDAPFHEAKVLAGASTLLDDGVPLVMAVHARGESWPETRDSLLRLLADYSDFAELRREARFHNDLGRLLELPKIKDLLAVQRPRGEPAAVGR